MAVAVARLAEEIVPGLGTVVYALDVVRGLWQSLHESDDLCRSVQTRLDLLWKRLLVMEEEGSIPRRFKMTDFTELVSRFHSLISKQAEKNIVVRIGTSGSFTIKLKECHEELDQICQLLQLDHIQEFMSWRNEWEYQTAEMINSISQIAVNGQAILSGLGGIRESVEALTMLVHETQKQNEQKQDTAYLKAMCYQVANKYKLELPTSVPPWFFTFDDIDFDNEPFKHCEADAMGTVHLGTWGGNTNVVVKCIDLLANNQAEPSPTAAPKWKEADVWWTLNHPNVLRMYGACHVTQPAFIVCEEAGYGNIREYLSADYKHMRRIWRLMHGTAVGLVHLRERNVVHGNIKSSNILVGDDERAKISDFGFSFVKVASTKSGNGAANTQSGSGGRWPAPELIAAADRGEKVVPSFQADVYAFAVCMLELVSDGDAWGNEQFLAKATMNPRRPRGISDDAWDLIKRMTCPDPSERLTIHQVAKRLRRIAEDEEKLEQFYSTSSELSDEMVASTDIDTHREAYEHEQATNVRLQRELEDLRQKVREEERELERVMERRQRVELAETQKRDEDERRVDRGTLISASLPTKHLLRILRWGTPEEQNESLDVLDKFPKDHSAVDIVSNNGLEAIIACMKHGHSTAFRQQAMDVLQSITTAGEGHYIGAVLEHGATQVLMSVLHYRGLPKEQRRAAQFLVVLAVKSARARSFFLSNKGLDLLIKLLWHSQLVLYDDHFKRVCEPELIDEMRQFLATQAETRTRDGERAMEKSNRDLAMQKFTEAVLLDPRNGRIFAKRSEVYASFRKFDQAARDALQCIKRLPDYGEGYFRHAIALYGLNQPEQADRAVRLGRQRDLFFFTRERIARLEQCAPRGDARNNATAWEIGSVDL